MKILMVNGPNLNLLGNRETDLYGSMTLDEIVKNVAARATELDVEIESFQSNEEGALVTRIGESPGKFDGIILNPAAYTHTSVALRDALQACKVPCVEVHLSNVHAREDFRHKSLTVGVCVGQVMGFGADSYILALEGLVLYLKRSGG
jgi:3-dehydroquinate dehydratase-2